MLLKRSAVCIDEVIFYFCILEHTVVILPIPKYTGSHHDIYSLKCMFPVGYNSTGYFQAGSRKGRGTIDNICIIQSIVDYSLELGGNVYCAFIDFRKAFDYLNRDCLWFKLLKSGIRGSM